MGLCPGAHRGRGCQRTSPRLPSWEVGDLPLACKPCLQHEWPRAPTPLLPGDRGVGTRGCEHRSWGSRCRSRVAPRKSPRGLLGFHSMSQFQGTRPLTRVLLQLAQSEGYSPVARGARQGQAAEHAGQMGRPQSRRVWPRRGGGLGCSVGPEPALRLHPGKELRTGPLGPPHRGCEVEK